MPAGKLYGEVDPLAHGRDGGAERLAVAGSYHLVCSVNDGAPVNGPKVAVDRQGHRRRGVLRSPRLSWHRR